MPLLLILFAPKSFHDISFVADVEGSFIFSDFLFDQIWLKCFLDKNSPKQPWWASFVATTACLLCLFWKEKSKSRRPPTASDSLAREALWGRYWVQIFTVVAKKVSWFSHHYWLVLSVIHQFCVLKFTLWSAVNLIKNELHTELLCSILIRR